jgi:acetyltransferase-like isoleucine patch superfamily enzyme
VLAKPITIGAGSWIGCNVTLLPGANIAPGCVIGAGSVVTKPTLPDGVYVGAPARLVRFLTADGSAELPAELALPS